MDFSDIPLISAITRKMGWLTQRQRVLSEDVANVDTPGFRVSDLRPLDFSRELAAVAKSSSALAGDDAFPPGLASPLAPATPTAGQLPGLDAASDQRNRVEGSPDDHSIDGNTASLEEELMKVAHTAADYQLMTELYQKQIGMMNTALDRGGT